MPKHNELTVNEVKKMIYNEIQKKQKRVDPANHNMRIVEDNMAKVEGATNIRNDIGRGTQKRDINKQH